jgi:hypothetical protein
MAMYALVHKLLQNKSIKKSKSKKNNIMNTTTKGVPVCQVISLDFE